MTDPAVQTLFLPLEEGAVSVPDRALFLNALWHPFLQTHPAMECQQSFKPFADTLRPGSTVLLENAGGHYGLILLHAPKQAEEARYMIARALFLLEDDGYLLVAAANDAGGGRLEKWLKEAGLSPFSQSKNKARVTVAQKKSLDVSILSAWIAEGSARDMKLGDDFSGLTQPGVFSWDHADEGSRLLAAHLPDTLSGDAADFGCGIGYLSCCLLKKAPRIRSLALVEADARALSFAESNVGPVLSGRSVSCHWHDLQKPFPASLPYDVIVMNPPFHTGKKTDPDLGAAFIARAAQCLKKGGQLFMVANSHLPYEDVLQSHFSYQEKLNQKKGFKIIRAMK